jgi:hypothetical protein
MSNQSIDTTIGVNTIEEPKLYEEVHPNLNSYSYLSPEEILRNVRNDVLNLQLTSSKLPDGDPIKAEISDLIHTTQKKLNKLGSSPSGKDAFLLAQHFANSITTIEEANNKITNPTN